MAKKRLSTEVAEKYILERIPAEKRTFDKIGVIDFTTLTLKEADRLYAAGFKYLKLKPMPKPKSKK